MDMKKYGPNEDTILNLLVYWNIVKKRGKFIVSLVAACTVIAAIFSLTLPKMYMAQAVIVPIGGGGGGLSLAASQMSGMSFLGMLGGGAVRTASQQLMNLFLSRTMAKRVIDKMNFMSIEYKKDWDVANQRLKDGLNEKKMYKELVDNLLGGYVQIKEDKMNSTITVKAIYNDPVIVEQLANTYVQELQALINENSFTTAKRNRKFIEGQVIENKRELLEAGKELNRFYDIRKISNVDSTVDISLDISRGKSKGENELDADILQRSTNEQLNEIEEQKDRIKKDIEKIGFVKAVPHSVYLQYLSLRRELLGSLAVLLAQQYELSKIDESKEDLQFQILDPAEEPLRRFKPQRKKIVVAAFIISLLGSVILAFLLDYVSRLKSYGRKDL